MANWYYYTENGDGTKEKIGPLDGSVLKQLTRQGIVTANTLIENEHGQTDFAKNLRGFPFDDAIPSEPTPPPMPKQVFCTNCGNAVAEKAIGCPSCGLDPVKYKRFCRQCGVRLNPEQVICVKCGAKLNDAPNRPGTVENTSPEAKTLNIYFMVLWIGIAVGLLGLFFGILFRAMGDNLVSQGCTPGDGLVILLGLSVMVSTLGSLAGTIFGLMLLYRLWKLIPKHIARTTPGKAVVFCLIPLFNFYWWFIAYFGLCKDMNKTLLHRGIQYRVNEGLGLLYCILAIYGTILSWFAGFALALAVIGAMSAIAVGVIGIFFYKSIKDGGIALLEQQNA